MPAHTMELPQIDDYRSLFLNDTPLLDVRAPVEFNQGAFPHTENFPLMNDQERAAVGTRYTQDGQDAAIRLGHELVQGKVKAERVDHWEAFFKAHPHGVLYCFRGGMRSKISQQWVYERTGIPYPRVKGGYKAMRRFLIDELEVSTQKLQPVILSGPTGSGKTRLLNRVRQKLDLEGVFNHRGSVFGKHVTPQPTQIDIENTLSIELLKALHRGHGRLLLEDEGTNIGPRSLPHHLYEKMQASPIVLLETGIDQRVGITFQEYIIDDLAEHQEFYGEEQGFRLWAQQLLDSIDKIQRRVGGTRHKLLKALLENAIQQHTAGNLEAHREWIQLLLVEYYDPMYDYQLDKKRERVIFQGKEDAALEYLRAEFQIG